MFYDVESYHYILQGWGEDSEGAWSRQLWGGQFWQVEGHRCCHQGRELIMMMLMMTMMMATITTTIETWQASSSQLQELLGMDKASNYSATASQGAGYKDEDKYEKERNVSRYIFSFVKFTALCSFHAMGSSMIWKLFWISTQSFSSKSNVISYVSISK